MMIVVTYVAFSVLTLVCIILTYKSWREREGKNLINNPNFKSFQKQYFPAYCLALVADWLQGPYLYKLYRDYGFEQAQIAMLYVFGHASTVMLGTWAPFIANKFGRKNLCIAFTMLYSISCFMKLSRSYGLLLLGRIFGGMATAVLFSSFEAWYLYEHIERHDFPKEWISDSMKKLSILNGSLAVVSGLVANAAAEWLQMGSIAPFMLAIPCLLISGIIVITTWEENYGTEVLHFKATCISGLREIGDSQKILLLGTVQSLFESVLALMVFLWTPILAPGHPSFGIVFSSFMVCIMIGNAVFDILNKKIHRSIILVAAISLAFFACCCCAIFAHYNHVNVRVCFIAFLFYEISVGMYFTAMGKFREDIIPETHAISIMNWFRVPLNIISCIVLMLLRDESFRHGNRIVFVICSCLLCGALICTTRLIPLIKTSTPPTVEGADDNDVFIAVSS